MTHTIVMPGLDPGIHAFTAGVGEMRVDGRVKPGHVDQSLGA
jgi:hypothetical protein